jgi:hypothetical protein
MSRPLDLLAWGAALLVAAWLLGPVGAAWYHQAMTDNERAPVRRHPSRITPSMVQARGEPPEHSPERPHRPYTPDEARRRARRRLEEWRRDHGQR